MDGGVCGVAWTWLGETHPHPPFTSLTPQPPSPPSPHPPHPPTHPPPPLTPPHACFASLCMASHTRRKHGRRSV